MKEFWTYLFTFEPKSERYCSWHFRLFEEYIFLEHCVTLNYGEASNIVTSSYSSQWQVDELRTWKVERFFKGKFLFSYSWHACYAEYFQFYFNFVEYSRKILLCCWLVYEERTKLITRLDFFTIFNSSNVVYVFIVSGATIMDLNSVASQYLIEK